MKCAERLAPKPSREGSTPEGRDYRLGSREPGPQGRGSESPVTKWRSTKHYQIFGCFAPKLLKIL